MSTSSSDERALALDLDGTLIDPRPRQVEVLAALAALRALGEQPLT